MSLKVVKVTDRIGCATDLLAQATPGLNFEHYGAISFTAEGLGVIIVADAGEAETQEQAESLAARAALDLLPRICELLMQRVPPVLRLVTEVEAEAATLEARGQ